MTSVKEFRVAEPATANSLGRGVFEFTDDYSVFDWGKMPDGIPDKGASLCTMGAFNFDLLEGAGVPTHYRGVEVEGEIRSLAHAFDAGVAPSTMAIDLTQVPDLPFRGEDDGGADGEEKADGERVGYDYDAFHAEAGENYLVPLEIVFRNQVGVGSSLRTRTDPADHGLDFDQWPEEDVELEDPIVEFSTKYEERDRYLDRAAADRIAGVADVDDLESTAREVNRIVTGHAEESGFVHQDGKIECLYVDGEIRVADVVGTFDENRFSYDGQQVSKEAIRQYHKRTQPEWVEAVGEAKSRADAEGVADWKSLCDRSPEPLDASVIQVMRDLYCAGTNAYVDNTVFDAPAVDDAVAAVRKL